MRIKQPYLFLVLLFYPALAQSQWSIRTPNLLKPFSSDIKLSEHYEGGGIFVEQGKIWISASPNSDTNNFFSSSDIGTSWMPVAIPQLTGYVRNFSFWTKDSGIAIPLCRTAYNNDELSITYDGGLTWKNGLMNCSFGKGLALGLNRLVFTIGPGFTSDQGYSWSTGAIIYAGGGMFGPDNSIWNLCKDNTGILYCSGKNAFYTSRDSGLTWIRQVESLDADCYSSSAHRSCHDSVIYIMNESGSPPKIYVSTNGGSSFNAKLISSPRYLSGTLIASKRGAAFAATANGILMTSDFGNTWKNIGGPAGLFDENSFALIDDSTIVALDTLGNVWIDEHIPIPSPTIHYPVLRGFSLGISSCDSGKSVVTLQHSYCSPLFILKAEPSGMTSPMFTVKTVSLPDTIDQMKTFTIPVSFNPDRVIGTFSGGVKIHGYYLDEGDSICIDTTILFSAKSKPVPPIFVASQISFKFDTLSTCVPPQDTTVTLTNKGCDTLQIISGPGLLAAEFSLLTPLTLPLKLAPDSSITLKFRFKPSGTGLFRTRATFTAEQQTLTQDISINLQGEGEKDVGVLSFAPKKFNFPSISVCNHDSASGFVANIGCDSMRLDPAAIFGNPDFKLTANSLQLTVKPKDTIRYEVYLNPAQKGLRQGFLVLNSNDGVKSRRDTVPFTVTVTDGTRILAASVNNADFGKTTVCDERDTIIHLANHGCDTLQISGYGVSGIGFASDTKFPIIILPGKDTIIHVFTVLDTIGGKTSNSGLLTFMSNSDNTLSPITLNRSYIPSRKIDVGLYLDPAVKAGGDLSTVSYDIKESPGKSFTGAGIKLINFNLNYNTDLLDFQSSKSSGNISSSDGKSFTISGSPEITADANGILASVGFRVYLTKDSVTSINMTNRTDTTNLPCSIMTLSMGGSAIFDYQFLCGERSIAEFMNGTMPMRIISMRPNPAQDEIEINVQSAIKQNANIEIFNALGAKVLSDRKNITSGTNTFHIDTKGLASGMYLVRVGEVSQSLVINH